MRYPDFIEKNSKIAFIAPSFGCNTEPYRSAFRNAVKKFHEAGFDCVLGSNCYADDGIGISSSPKKCAMEFNEFWASLGNDCIISCGGGELMCEILEYIDFERIRVTRPKWFMGYSDNTNLEFLLTTMCNTASLYGPCAPAFGMEPWHPAVEDAFQMLCGQKQTVNSYNGWQKESLRTEDTPLVPYNITEKTTFRMMNYDTSFSGRLIGGCMDILRQLTGTKYDHVGEFLELYREDGFIWFLEACDLSTMDIRRALWQLEQAGWFKYAKGFLIGRPYHFDDEAFGLNRYTAVTGILKKYKLPILLDLDIGHLPPAMPLINGSFATVSAEDGSVKIKMELK